MVSDGGRAGRALPEVLEPKARPPPPALLLPGAVLKADDNVERTEDEEKGGCALGVAGSLGIYWENPTCGRSGFILLPFILTPRSILPLEPSQVLFPPAFLSSLGCQCQP